MDTLIDQVRQSIIDLDRIDDVLESLDFGNDDRVLFQRNKIKEIKKFLEKELSKRENELIHRWNA